MGLLAIARGQYHDHVDALAQSWSSPEGMLRSTESTADLTDRDAQSSDTAKTKAATRKGGSFGAKDTHWTLLEHVGGRSGRTTAW